MKLEIEFSGLMCGIRRWRRGSDFPADNKNRHPIVMLGAPGGGAIDPQALDAGTVPLHYPRLTVPLAAVDTTTVDPIEIVETPQAQIGVWDLTGQSVTLSARDAGGVRVTDDNRPRELVSKRKGQGPSVLDDWNDIAWVAELDRIFKSHVALGVDLQKPDPGIVSFAMYLNSGELKTIKPRSDYHAGSTFAFDPEINEDYWQAFSDRLRVSMTDATIDIELTPLRGGTKQTIGLKADARVCVSSLSRSMTSETEDPDMLTHFAGLYPLFKGLAKYPIPVRKTAPKDDGQLTVEPFFCLLAFHNVDDI